MAKILSDKDPICSSASKHDSPVLRACTKPGGWGIKIKTDCGHKNRIQPIRSRERNAHVLNTDSYSFEK